MSDDLAFLMTAPNEPMAAYWRDVLADEGIPQPPGKTTQYDLEDDSDHGLTATQVLPYS